MTRTRTNLALLVLVVALVVVAAVLYARGRESDAEARATDYSSIVDAAETEMTAFLTMDHKRFDELSAAVLGGATGNFKKEYTASLDSLKKTAEDEEWVAEPKIDAVGISHADSDSATVFVSAGTTEKFKSAGDDSKSRPWRIKLEMVKESGRWMVSEVGYVS